MERRRETVCRASSRAERRRWFSSVGVGVVGSGERSAGRAAGKVGSRSLENKISSSLGKKRASLFGKRLSIASVCFSVGRNGGGSGFCVCVVFVRGRCCSLGRGLWEVEGGARRGSEVVLSCRIEGVVSRSVSERRKV